LNFDPGVQTWPTPVFCRLKYSAMSLFPSPLPQTHARATAVLVNELDAGGF
jgi:hypothetical protein